MAHQVWAAPWTCPAGVTLAPRALAKPTPLPAIPRIWRPRSPQASWALGLGESSEDFSTLPVCPQTPSERPAIPRTQCHASAEAAPPTGVTTHTRSTQRDHCACGCEGPLSHGHDDDTTERAARSPVRRDPTPAVQPAPTPVTADTSTNLCLTAQAASPSYENTFAWSGTRLGSVRTPGSPLMACVHLHPHPVS